LKLKKALYGLKQAPRAWNSRNEKYFQVNGFSKCPREHALYCKVHKNGDILIVCLYVDDLIFTGNNPGMFEDFKKAKTKEFEMTNIGLMAYYLGIEVKQMEDGIFISQEGYADSVQGDAGTSVVALGAELARVLQEKHEIQVMHHAGCYDVPDHAKAYSNALPNIEQILRENPAIEVVIDLHRDGVPSTTRLVTEINGKPTAQIMFFNGLSRTSSQGNLAYLPNPYIEDNLAFSFQMQLAADEYFPGFARKIYLKGYRYNMHVMPKSMLVEVGAQTNTFAEAKNAMEPLADLLALVLKGS